MESKPAGFTLRKSSPPAETEELYGVWRRAVLATHSFIKPEDIEFYAHILRELYLPTVSVLIAADDATDAPIGFLGGDGGQIDSLFIDPAWHRRGVGRRLMQEAFKRSRVMRVAVNEPNTPALAFYLSLGFEIVSRTETDAGGKPYPLLHLLRMDR